MMDDTKKIRGRKIKVDQENKKVISSNSKNVNNDEVVKKTVKNKKIKKVMILDENVSDIKDVKSKHIDSDLTDEQEDRLDMEIEHKDDLSITLMICILVLCFFVGISLGYMLYRIAINSSNVMMLVRYFIKV